MYYAVKAVDGKIMDLITEDWEECKRLVLGKNSIYRSFPQHQEALEYIQSTTVDIELREIGYAPSDEGAQCIRGYFLFPRFRDEKTGFTCNVYQTKRGQRVTCRGYGLPENKKVLYCFGGHYVVDEKYGFEFEVESFKEVIEDTKEGIISYLGSGVMKGVGEKKAAAIYKEFGPRTMEILEKNPEKLQYVKGFSKKSAQKAMEQLQANKGAMDITRYLLRFGISQKYAMELYRERKGGALGFVQKHPYSLCRFKGISFEEADQVAKDCDIPLNDKERIDYCIFHVLKTNEISGDTGMEWNTFCSKAMQFLGPNVQKEDLSQEIVALKKNGRLTIRRMKNLGISGVYVFSQKAFEREMSIAKDILRIKEDRSCKKIADIDEKILKKEQEYGFSLDKLQREAVKAGLTGEPFMVLTGDPGTGKTTIIRMIADIYGEEGDRVVFLAPTGRAARRMTETSGRPSKTFHSFFHIADEEDERNPEDEISISNALVVADEFSMADVYVSQILFSAIQNGCRVILVGDADQLPSVGPGAVLRDILESGVVKVVRLQKIFRQGENERITENAAKVKSGNGNILEGSDFHIHELANMEDVKNVMAELYMQRVEEFGIGNVICLCPFIKHTAGVKDMNITLQEIVNPPGAEKPQMEIHGETFRLGDLVMHLKNNENVSNGDIGTIVKVDPDEKIITVLINGMEIEYDVLQLKELTLAYATTVHKAQGSETAAVICTFTNFHTNMLYRNLLNVAFSRAKKQVDVVGEMSAIRKAAETETKEKRITLTGYFLKYYGGKFVEIA